MGEETDIVEIDAVEIDTVELDIYTGNGIDESMENSEISPWEEGFMRGYMGAL